MLIKKSFLALALLGTSALTLADPSAANRLTPEQRTAQREARMAEHFRLADTDRNGQLSTAEFRTMHDQRRAERREHMHERRQHGVQKRLERADLNRDGQISRQEARDHLPGVDRRFDRLDANRDGQVSATELHPNRPR